ncbi:MAG: ketopantoate reductase family protein [Methanotrichaceae archaeon]|nr:ketopantoate reductase family protein [Methanotrichaceae archaeon]
MANAASHDYLIFGTGAMGSVLAGFLQDTGCRVTMIGRGNHFSALLAGGLRVTGIWGDRFIPAERVRGFADPRKAKGRFPVILLCVKSKDTAAAALDASRLLAEDGIMVSIQNGLDNWDIISSIVGPSRTVGARVIFGAEISEPGTARVTVNADDVLLGEPFSAVNRGLLASLEDDLRRSGIPVRSVSSAEIWSAIWGKVLYNSSLNPLGALLEVPYGKLGENRETRDVIRHIIEEIFLVMSARGVKVPYADADDYYHHLLKCQLPPTYDHRASMLQDILLGRRTEIDALNGAISRYGRELGIATPYNDLLTALIKFKEKPENRTISRTAATSEAGKIEKAFSSA